jgi:hypothetical protein
MKRLILNLMQWAKSLFAKKSESESKEHEFPEIGTFEPLPIEPLSIYNVVSMDENDSDEDLAFVKDKKQAIKMFNEKNSNEKLVDETWVEAGKIVEHKEVLKETVRSKKPNNHKASKNVEFKCDNGVFNLTTKQHFFITKIKELANENGNVKANVICKQFIEMKYEGATESVPEKQFKEDYHKNTFKYLVKQGLIKKFPRGMYKVNY